MASMNIHFYSSEIISLVAESFLPFIHILALCKLDSTPSRFFLGCACPFCKFLSSFPQVFEGLGWPSSL